MKEEFQNIRLIDRENCTCILKYSAKIQSEKGCESGGEHSMAQKPALVILKEEEDMNR